MLAIFVDKILYIVYVYFMNTFNSYQFGKLMSRVRGGTAVIGMTYLNS